MTKSRCDCLCLGIVVADHVCEPIDHVPRAGELVLTAQTRLSLGGCAANVAVGLSRLGHRAAIVGRVGDDVFGRWIADELRAAGVDCRHLAASAGESTSCSLIVNVRNEDRRFIHARGANRLLTGSEISTDALQQASVVYLGGYCLSEQPSPQNVTALFRAARDCGVQTVLDVVIPGPGDYSEFLDPVLPWTDVFLPNRDEAQAITGQANPLVQAREFRKRGAATVVITCGPEGAVVASGGDLFRAARFAVEFVDGTGSGDAFSAGYIHGLLQGADVRDCVRIGSALGASCVRAIGATTGLFSSVELADFLMLNELEIMPL